MSIAEYHITVLAITEFYTEGPAIDRPGHLYFTDLKGGAIYQYRSDQTLRKWAESPCPNGQVILQNGDHLICDVSTSSIRRYDTDGNFKADIMNMYCAGARVHCPNDIAVDKNNTIYFSDSIRYRGKVFAIRGNSYQQIIADNIDYPNGVLLSADNEWLFIAESFKNRILKLHLATGEMNVWCNLPSNKSGRVEDNLPDGLALDTKGNIWVAHHGMQAVHQLSPEGVLINSFDTSFPLASNIIIHENIVYVTGGYNEPGPGKVVKIEL